MERQRSSAHPQRRATTEAIVRLRLPVLEFPQIVGVRPSKRLPEGRAGPCLELRQPNTVRPRGGAGSGGPKKQLPPREARKQQTRRARPPTPPPAAWEETSRTAPNPPRDAHRPDPP